jgi:hypothetical protein
MHYLCEAFITLDTQMVHALLRYVFALKKVAVVRYLIRCTRNLLKFRSTRLCPSKMNYCRNTWDGWDLNPRPLIKHIIAISLSYTLPSLLAIILATFHSPYYAQADGQIWTHNIRTVRASTLYNSLTWLLILHNVHGTPSNSVVQDCIILRWTIAGK